MPDSQHQNEHSLILNGTDQPLIAYAIPPERSQFGAVKCLADASWIIQLRNPVEEKFQDAVRNLPVQLAELTICLR